jgi:hypothetical protein
MGIFYVEVTTAATDDKVSAGLFKREGDIGSFLTDRISCTMSLLLRVLWSIKKGYKEVLSHLW